jgi:tetratricopeptide (TPR) repeat protein
MKVFLFTFVLLSTSSFAQQPTRAQLEKMQKDMEKKAASLEKSLGPGEKTNTENEADFKAPKKQVKLLTALPKANFTPTQYTAFVKSLVLKFESQPNNKRAIDFVRKNHNHKTSIEFYQSSFLLWYKGKQPEAIYTGLKAISLDPENTVALNNLCAFLNLSGYPHKAIPMLKYALAKEKNSSTLLLNNIGQAYYQLGDFTTSKNYLSSCVQIEQYHIEANNTLGHIETINGNTAAATQHYKNSLKGGYNSSAASRLGKLGGKPEDAINLPPPNSYPETDDNIGFSCPSIPGDVTQNVAFNLRLRAESEAFDQAQEDYTTRINESMQQRGMQIANTMMAGGRPNMHTGPMFAKAALVMQKAFVDFEQELQRLTKDYDSWKEEWNQRYADRFTHACDNAANDEACCRARRNIQSAKQAEFALRYNQYCSQVWANAKGYSNVVHYWTPFLSSQRGNILDKDLMNARNTLFSTAISLTRAAGVDEDFCLDDLEAPAVTKNPQFSDPPCNFMVKIPLGVGDVKIDCEKISISGGEGMVGEAEYNFVKGQTTIAAGIGTKVSTGALEAELSAKYYITINGDLSMQDIGVKYSGGIAAGQARVGPVQVEAVSAEWSVTVGVNTGVNASTSVSAVNYNLFKQEISI